MLLCAFALASPRGTTQTDFPTSGTATEFSVGLGKHEFWQRVNRQGLDPGPDIITDRESWMTIDSLDLNVILPAGHQIGAQFYNPNASFLQFSSVGSLIPASVLAISKAPNWLRPELRNVLSQLSNDRQQAWADIINTAIDPYIDEIAFCIANSSVVYLESTLSMPQLFVENAHKIYEIDAELQYVQIINYGNSQTDEDYYSTTSYAKIDAAGQTVTVEVPKDIYYWYIVHPKLTDEIPAYIDPAIIENNSNHTNNIVPPPTGKFWRSYLYDVQEDNYPSLADTLRLVQTLFNHNGNTQDAIRAITWWINQTMAFTSNSERPHQPVRIYRKHFGRCGEYADYTSAAARIALIPCTSILSMSTDHTWNEFWDEEWIQWEPVNGYINAPLVYENGWGKVFGSVFEIRSDGYLTSVTDRYSEGLATISLSVVDEYNTPIDGARVILAFSEGGYRVDMVSFTDNMGVVVFPVGEGRSYFARVETSFAIYPPNPGTYSALAQDVVDEGDYYYQFVMETALPLPTITDMSPIPDPVMDWRFAILYSVPRYYISGRVTWDDISATGTYPKFYKLNDVPGDAALLITDSDNIMFYQSMQFCEALHYTPASAQGNFMYEIPTGQDYYTFLDNSHRHANAPLIEGALLFQHYGVTNQDDYGPIQKPRLYQNFPNPFNPTTTIAFDLAKPSPVNIEIYNLKGQLVKTLVNSDLTAGQHSIIWNGKDENNRDLSSGVYFYRMETQNYKSTNKMLLMK